MADEQLRELERLHQETGTPASEEAWLRALVRAGGLDAERCGLLASLGSPGAAAIAAEQGWERPPHVGFPEDARELAATLAKGGFVPQASLTRIAREWRPWCQAASGLAGLIPRVLVCVARLALRAWQELYPDDAWADERLSAAELLLSDPNAQPPPFAVKDPGRQEMCTQSPYAKIDTLADRLVWAYKEGAYRDVCLHLCFSGLQEGLEEDFGTAFVIAGAALGAGPDAVLQALRRDLSGWLCASSDLPPRAALDAAELLQRGAQVELRQTLRSRNLGYDVARIAARCGSSVAAAALAGAHESEASEACARERRRPLPHGLRPPSDLARLLALRASDPLVREWTRDCVAHALASMPVGPQHAPKFQQALDRLAEPVTHSDSPLDGLVRNNAATRNPWFRLGWAFAHARQGDLAWARRDAADLPAALVRQARGAPLPAEPGRDPAIEGEARAATEVELDWQLRRLFRHLEGDAPPLSRRSRPVLRVLSGAQAGEIFELDPARAIRIGRSTEADVQVYGDDHRVSRLHAQLRCVGGTWFLRNLSSSGILLGGAARVDGEETVVPGSPFSLSARVSLVVDYDFLGRRTRRR